MNSRELTMFAARVVRDIPAFIRASWAFSSEGVGERPTYARKAAMTCWAWRPGEVTIAKATWPGVAPRARAMVSADSVSGAGGWPRTAWNRARTNGESPDNTAARLTVEPK